MNFCWKTYHLSEYKPHVFLKIGKDIKNNSKNEEFFGRKTAKNRKNIQKKKAEIISNGYLKRDETKGKMVWKISF